MLNPNALRKKTEEAAARIEQERQLEEDRLRQEAEIRRQEAARIEQERQLEEERQRQEAERLKQELAKRARLQKLAAKTASQMLRQAIVAASQGNRSIHFEVSHDIIPALRYEMQQLGLHSEVWPSIDRNITLENRLSKLVEKLGSDWAFVNYKSRLLNALSPDEKSGEKLSIGVILALLDKMQSDRDLRLSNDAIRYVNLTLKPYLLSLSDTTKGAASCFHISWKPVDVVDAVMSKLEQAPSWLLSTGGWGLMQRIGLCMALDADAGKGEAVFELVSLPVTIDRWGQNTMTKLIHRQKAVGVTPFSPQVFEQIVQAMEFKAVLSESKFFSTLNIGW